MEFIFEILGGFSGNFMWLLWVSSIVLVWFCGVLSGSGVVFCGSWVVELGEHDEDDTEDEVVVVDELFDDRDLGFKTDELLWMQFVEDFVEVNIASLGKGIKVSL